MTHAAVIEQPAARGSLPVINGRGKKTEVFPNQ